LEVLSSRTRDIDRAARIVRKGGVIAFPTDTVYGLGCDPRDPHALSRLLSAKGRVRGRKPFPILVASSKLAEQIAVMDGRAKALAARFWPGALTIVLRPRISFPRSLTMCRKTIAVRCPGNRVALQLVRKCGGFLTGTSANTTGRPPCTSAEAVRRALGERIDAVVDGGRSPRRAGSTIVRVNSRGVTILRKGPIRYTQIRRAIQGPPTRSKRTPKRRVIASPHSFSGIEGA